MLRGGRITMRDDQRFYPYRRWWRQWRDDGRHDQSVERVVNRHIYYLPVQRFLPRCASPGASLNQRSITWRTDGDTSTGVNGRLVGNVR